MAIPLYSLIAYIQHVVFALILLLIVYLILARLLGYKYRKQLFGKRKITMQTTDIPFGGNLFAAYYAQSNQGRVFPSDSGRRELSEALFLRWVFEGTVELMPINKTQADNRYLIPEKAARKDKEENKLLDFFRKAAGDDHILDPDELGRWAYDHPMKVFSVDFKEHSKMWFEDHNYIRKQTPFNIYLKPEYMAEARRVVELQNYFRALQEGNAIAPPPDDRLTYYLEFAVICRMGDVFMKALREWYPAQYASLAAKFGCERDYLDEVYSACIRTVVKMWDAQDDEVEDDTEVGDYKQ